MRSIRDMGKKTVDSDTTDGRSLREELGAVAAKYEGRTEEELMQELRKKVATAKRDGSYSAEQLQSFVAMISPSLDDDMRERLISLVKMIESY